MKRKMRMEREMARAMALKYPDVQLRSATGTRNKKLLKPSVTAETPPHPDAVAALAKLRFA